MSNMFLKKETLKEELANWITGITAGVINEEVPLEVEYDIIKDYFKKSTFKVSPSLIKLQPFNDQRLIDAPVVVATKLQGIEEYVALCGNEAIIQAGIENKKIDIVFIDWLKIITLTKHQFNINPHTMNLLRHIANKKNVVFGSAV